MTGKFSGVISSVLRLYFGFPMPPQKGPLRISYYLRSMNINKNFMDTSDHEGRLLEQFS